MNDEQLEHELAAALLEDDPGELPESLRWRVARVTEERSRRRGPAAPRVRGWVASLEAAAAVVVVGAIIVAALSMRSQNPGPGATGPTPSASSPIAPTTAQPSTTPPSQPPSVPGAWQGLRWSNPVTFPDSGTVTEVVAWQGKFIAAGAVPNGTNYDAAVWRSTDGTTWTRVTSSAFAGSQIRGLVTSASGLVAWGFDGEPTCSGSGEGMTCGPFPVMIWTSPDGIAWNRIADVSTFASATISDVTYGGQGLVAVGDKGWTQPTIWTSDSGTVWEPLPAQATFKDGHFSGVQATAWGYVLGGSVGGTAPVSGGIGAPNTGVAAAWWSTDGRTWTHATVKRENGIGTSLDSISVGAYGMVAVGSASGGKSGTAWISTDGSSWQPLAVAYAGAAIPPGVPALPSWSVVGDGTRLVAVGQDAAFHLAIWCSVDGRDWQRLQLSGATTTLPATMTPWMIPGGLFAIGGPGGPDAGTLWRAMATP